MTRPKTIAPSDFQFVCRLRFEDLEGKSNLRRFCRSCNRVVHNIDMYTDEGLQALIDDAAAQKSRLCVNTATRLHDGRPCGSDQVSPLMGDLIPELLIKSN